MYNDCNGKGAGMSRVLMPPIVELLEPRVLLSAAEAPLVNATLAVWRQSPEPPAEMPPPVEFDLGSPLLMEQIEMLKALYSHPKISSGLMELRHTINMSIVNRTFHSFKQFQVPLPGTQIDDYGTVKVTVQLSVAGSQAIIRLENAGLLRMKTSAWSNDVIGWIGYNRIVQLATVEGVVWICATVGGVLNGGDAPTGDGTVPAATNGPLGGSVQEASLTDGAAAWSGDSPASGERLEAGDQSAASESTAVDALSILATMPVTALGPESTDEATAIGNLTRIGDESQVQTRSAYSPWDDIATGVLVRAATVLL